VPAALVALALFWDTVDAAERDGLASGRGHASRSWTLRCGPVGGTLPGRVRACARLAKAQDDVFAPVPQATACSQVYGGPHFAVVRGLFRGRRWSATFTRRNGCEISRWNRVAFLFPVRL